MAAAQLGPAGVGGAGVAVDGWRRLRRAHRIRGAGVSHRGANNRQEGFCENIWVGGGGNVPKSKLSSVPLQT